MDSFPVLILIGLAIGTMGTLIGAGGGFLLVPLLLLFRPDLSPVTVTAISIAIVAANAISGTLAYAKSRRIDYRAGWLFALFTIPGSVLGVFLTNYIPHKTFSLIFSVLLLSLSTYLLLKHRKRSGAALETDLPTGKGWHSHTLTDRSGHTYSYSYNQTLGYVISGIVGFISPLLGIGGGIIHVPAMVQWLHFPVYVATATSHFILAIMATISVVVHAVGGDYNNPEVLRLLAGLAIGVIPGAQIGAQLSHRISTTAIIKALAVCLALVGIRILVGGLS